MPMNLRRFAAHCQEYVARADEAWGAFSGDRIRVAEARRARILAVARQRREIEREESARQLEDFRQRNRNWHY